jgi:hypothetical protein
MGAVALARRFAVAAERARSYLVDVREAGDADVRFDGTGDGV